MNPEFGEVPLKINCYKFLIEERKSNLINFAKVKFEGDVDYIVFKTMAIKHNSL
jgi:hypothetical protein